MSDEGRPIYETVNERKERLRNIVDIMQKFPENFQIALADEEMHGADGFGSSPADDVTFALHGEKYSVFEFYEDKRERSQVIVDDEAFAETMSRSFADMWRVIPQEQRNQNIIIETFRKQIRDIV